MTKTSDSHAFPYALRLATCSLVLLAAIAAIAALKETVWLTLPIAFLERCHGF